MGFLTQEGPINIYELLPLVSSPLEPLGWITSIFLRECKDLATFNVALVRMYFYLSGFLGSPFAIYQKAERPPPSTSEKIHGANLQALNTIFGATLLILHPCCSVMTARSFVQAS